MLSLRFEVATMAASCGQSDDSVAGITEAKVIASV